MFNHGFISRYETKSCWAFILEFKGETICVHSTDKLYLTLRVWTVVGSLAKFNNLIFTTPKQKHWSEVNLANQGSTCSQEVGEVGFELFSSFLQDHRDGELGNVKSRELLCLWPHDSSTQLGLFASGDIVEIFCLLLPCNVQDYKNDLLNRNPPFEKDLSLLPSSWRLQTNIDISASVREVQQWKWISLDLWMLSKNEWYETTLLWPAVIRSCRLGTLSVIEG